MPAVRSGWAVEVRLDARPHALRLARRLAVPAALAAGLPPPAAFDLEVALGEALINAYQHAYGGRGRGRICVTFASDTTEFTVTVRDSGKPLSTPPRIPRSLSRNDDRGRGLWLMSQLTDDLEVIHPARRGRGTAVRMRVRRAQQNGTRPAATAPGPRAGRPRPTAGTGPAPSY